MVSELLVKPTNSKFLALEAYSCDIERFPLLTHKQEYSLGRLIKIKDRANRLLERANPPISSHRAAQLEVWIQRGNKAYKDFFNSNLRLVISIARKYTKRGLPLLDLIQEGNIGLMRAIDKFDPRLGFKFSTYATRWVQQGITRGITRQGRTIPLPINFNEELSKMATNEERLTQQLGKKPSDDELASVLGYPSDRLRRNRYLSQPTCSLNFLVGTYADGELENLVAKTNSKIDKDSQKMALMNRLKLALANLSETERAVIEIRHSSHNSLLDIGEILGLSAKEVKNVDTLAMGKLRRLLVE